MVDRLSHFIRTCTGNSTTQPSNHDDVTQQFQEVYWTLRDRRGCVHGHWPRPERRCAFLEIFLVPVSPTAPGLLRAGNAEALYFSHVQTNESVPERLPLQTRSRLRQNTQPFTPGWRSFIPSPCALPASTTRTFPVLARSRSRWRARTPPKMRSCVTARPSA